MRKEYGKALRARFSLEMKSALPQFEEVKVKSVYFWPGDRAFCWEASESLYCWIVLSPSNKDYEEFTVLIGWSKLGRFPELGMVPCAELPSAGREEFGNDEYLTRLPFLWGKEDRWWVVEELRMPLSVAELEASTQPISAAKANEMVAPAIEDAIEKLQERGVPYLEELVYFSTRSD
jgi:hypothetical protein